MKVYIYSLCDGKLGFYIRAPNREKADILFYMLLATKVLKSPHLEVFVVNEEELDEAEKRELDEHFGVWFFEE